MSCGWFARRRHASRRRADIQQTYTDLVRDHMLRALFDHNYDGLSGLQDAWAAFKREPGREHWRCACAPKERA